jgi:acyl dehydratase
MSAAPVGKSWPAHRYEVGLEKIREYAHAVGEEAPIFHHRDVASAAGFSSVPAPPVFAAVFCAPAVGAAIFDPEVGIFDPEVGIASYRFVHKAQHFDFHRPVLAGEAVTTTAQLSVAEDLDDGRALRIFESVSVDDSGAPLVSARYEGVVPPPMGAGGSRRSEPRAPLRAGPPAADPGRPGEGEGLADLRFTPDRYAPIRYAGASGDFTPFHLDGDLARAMALEGVILHGLYTFAQVARAHTAPFGSDPRTLRALSGRFRRPAYPERELLVRTVISHSDGGGRLRTIGEARQGDSSVIGDVGGLLELGAAAGFPSS